MAFASQKLNFYQKAMEFCDRAAETDPDTDPDTVSLSHETNLVEAFSRSDLAGDHVLSQKVFGDTVQDFLEQNGLSSLTDEQRGLVNDLMNRAENLRPMPRAFNSSRRALSATDWGNVDSDLAFRVNPQYLARMQVNPRFRRRPAERFAE